MILKSTEPITKTIIFLYPYRKLLWIGWILENKDEKSKVSYLCCSLSEDGCTRKLCKHLGIAYEGPDSDGK